jgi:hypothetical protein
VATGSVSGQVKLRDEIFQGKPIFGDTKFWGVALNPLEKIDGPTTSDII